MVVIVTVALFAMLVMVMIMVMIMLMIVAMAFLTVIVVMVMVMMLMAVVVSAGTFVLVYVEIDTAILHRMHHGMLQFALVHIHDGGHEVEIRLLGRSKTVVVLHADVQIREVERYSFTVNGDGHLDMAHQISGFLLHPSADLHHHGIQSCFGIRVESVYVSGETDTHTACQFFGIDHQITSNTSFTPSPVVAHMGMTFASGNSECSHSVISSIFSGDVRSFLFIAMTSEPESCLT